MNKKLFLAGVITVAVAFITHHLTKIFKTSIDDYSHTNCDGCTGCDEECAVDLCEECNNTSCCCNPSKREHILDM